VLLVHTRLQLNTGSPSVIACELWHTEESEFVATERYHEGLVILVSVQMFCTKDITLTIVFWFEVPEVTRYRICRRRNVPRRIGDISISPDAVY
jgi:hypothetical protein